MSVVSIRFVVLAKIVICFAVVAQAATAFATAVTATTAGTAATATTAGTGAGVGVGTAQQGDRLIPAIPLCADAGVSPGQVSRPVYRWQDKQGAIHYSECPPSSYPTERFDMLVFEGGASSRSAAAAVKSANSAKSMANAKSTTNSKSTNSAKPATTKKPSSNKGNTGAALERQRLARLARCNEARAKLRRIEDKFRRGYKVKEGERLRERHRQWSAVGRDNCENP